MNDVSSAMRNVLNKCEISVDGNTFSKEVLIQAYAEFLSQTMEKRKHNVGVTEYFLNICIVHSTNFNILKCLEHLRFPFLFQAACEQGIRSAENKRNIIVSPLNKCPQCRIKHFFLIDRFKSIAVKDRFHFVNDDQYFLSKHGT